MQNLAGLLALAIDDGFRCMRGLRARGLLRILRAAILRQGGNRPGALLRLGLVLRLQGLADGAGRILN